MAHFQPGWNEIPEPLLTFWTERHLCSLTTLRADGRPHVVPVGATLDLEQECAWVITRSGSQKVSNLRDGGPVAICQVDGGRWSTLEGYAEVRTDVRSIERAVERYASRYRQPQPNPERVALRIEVERLLFGPGLLRDKA